MQMKAFPHSNMADKYLPTISVMSSHSEEPVANFNIANLYKNAEESSWPQCVRYQSETVADCSLL